MSLIASQVALLERIATGAPLPELLEAIVRSVERQSDGMLGSILLLDRESQTARPGAAPSLPEAYTRALDGAPIGPYEGSCGAAAWHGERVIAEDIETHPNWQVYKALAIPHGLRACWSSPIFSPRREVLGTFGMYYTTTRGPSEADIAAVDVATHLASIAILRDQSERSLRESEARSRELARLHAISSRLAEAVVRDREPRRLMDLACRMLVDQGVARLAWVALAEEGASFEAAARCGEDDGQVDRALRALRAAGPQGAWSADFLDPTARGFPFVALRTRGVFVVHANAPDALGLDESRVLQAMAGDLALAMDAAANERERLRLVADLGKRVDELTLVHRVGRVLEIDRPVDDALLSELVHLFPGAFRFSRSCEARIALGPHELATAEFQPTPWMLVAGFDAGHVPGRIEIAYRERPPVDGWDGFLVEEEQLLRSIADVLGAHVGRKNVELALRQSEERLRAVVEHTPHVGIQWYDANGAVLFVNRTSQRLFGWTAERALGRTLDQLSFSPDETRRFGAILNEVFATGVPVGPIERRFVGPDERDGILLSTIFCIPYADGDRCVVCMDVDITEHRRMEERLRAGDKLRSLVHDNVSDGVFYLGVEPDGGFRVLSVNPALIAATGVLERDAVGKRVDAIVPEASRELALGKFRDAALLRRPVTWEQSVTYSAGSRAEEVTVAPVLDASGRCTNLVGTVRDVTARRKADEERRRLEGQLHRAERLQSLGTLVGGVAHDFNNIVTAIMGHADLAAMERSDAPAVASSLAEIRSASRRAKDLVGRILTFSGPPQTARAHVALEGIVTEALKLQRASLPSSIEVRTRFSHVPEIGVDATQVHQIVMNLTTNAAHALGTRGGRVDIAIEPVAVDATLARMIPGLEPAPYVCMTFSDDGPGMDPATAARVFEPFFTTKPQGRGTGLGLSVVHGIMNSHRGAVTVESDEGRGTTFRLYFPIAGIERPNSSAPPPAQVPPSKPRVLYVDDDDALVMLGIRVLKKLGYQVTGHTDPTKALAEFSARPHDFDAVVTDVTMPGLRGTSLASEIRKVRPDIRIALVSGYVRPEDLRRAHELGIDTILSKPQTMDGFADIVGRLVAPGTDATSAGARGNVARSR